MNALRRKWHSSRGASILMAMLFLLLCMMVGASVIMAAASNAGKIQSSQEEQQRYLALSSALRLVCDELEAVEYVGEYLYGAVQEIEYIDIVDDVGNVTKEKKYHDIRNYYWQKEGELRLRNGMPGSALALSNVIPLQNDLDKSFAQNFSVPEAEKKTGNSYHEKPLASFPSPLNPYQLELAADGVDSYGVLRDPVNITVTWNPNDGHIDLKAVFREDASYVMYARLKSNGTPGEVLCLKETPKNKPTLTEWVMGSAEPGEGIGVLNETDPLTWTLDYIFKGQNKEEVTGP